MKYLLDTNAWIALLNYPSGAVAKKLQSHFPSDVATNSVVISELLVGVYKSMLPAANLALVQQILGQFKCLVFDEVSADHYAKIRAHLESIGMPIGPYDMQIAAIAKQHGLTVVTNNFAEFSRVPGLLVEDWSLP
jgi:tRNA(fMet)-specific endonuclease VapC